MKPNTVVQSPTGPRAGRRRIFGWPLRIALFVMLSGLLIGISGSFVGEPFYEGLMVLMERLGAPEDRGFLPVPNPEKRYLGPQSWASPVIAEEMGRGILIWTGTMIFMLGLVLALFAILLGGVGLGVAFLLLFGLVFAYSGGILDSILYEFEPALEGTRFYDFLDRSRSTLELVGKISLGCGIALLLFKVLRRFVSILPTPSAGSGSSNNSSSSSGNSGSSGGSSNSSSSGNSGGGSGSSGSGGISNAARAHMMEQQRRRNQRGRRQ